MAERFIQTPYNGPGYGWQDSMAEAFTNLASSYREQKDIKLKTEQNDADRLAKLLPELATQGMLAPSNAGDKTAIKVPTGNGNFMYLKIQDSVKTGKPPDSQVWGDIATSLEGGGDPVSRLYQKADPSTKQAIIAHMYNTSPLVAGGQRTPVPEQDLVVYKNVGSKGPPEYGNVSVSDYINQASDPRNPKFKSWQTPGIIISDPTQKSNAMMMMNLARTGDKNPKEKPKIDESLFKAGQSVADSFWNKPVQTAATLFAANAAAKTAGQYAKPFMQAAAGKAAQQALSPSAQFFMKTGASAATQRAAAGMAAGLAARSAIAPVMATAAGAAAPASFGYLGGQAAGNAAFNMNPNMMNQIPTAGVAAMAHPLGYLFNQNYRNNPSGF